MPADISSTKLCVWDGSIERRKNCNGEKIYIYIYIRHTVITFVIDRICKKVLKFCARPRRSEFSSSGFYLVSIFLFFFLSVLCCSCVIPCPPPPAPPSAKVHFPQPSFSSGTYRTRCEVGSESTASL